MIPAAAVAAIRAAVEEAADHIEDDARRLAPIHTHDMAQRIADELTAHGWMISPAKPKQAPHTGT